MRFTAQVGCSNVFGFSTAVGAPGTAEDTAPLSTMTHHSAMERGWGSKGRRESRHRRNTIRKICRTIRPGVRIVVSCQSTPHSVGNVPAGVNRDDRIITEQIRTTPARSSSTYGHSGLELPAGNASCKTPPNFEAPSAAPPPVPQWHLYYTMSSFSRRPSDGLCLHSHCLPMLKFSHVRPPPIQGHAFWPCFSPRATQSSSHHTVQQYSKCHRGARAKAWLR